LQTGINRETAKADLLYCSHALKRRGLFENVETKMTKRKLFAFVGRSPDGARRVYGQDQDSARAMAEAFDAAREYLKQRPDCGPLTLWSFAAADDRDLMAVQFDRDVA
jgi:hypothetical protein